MALFVRGGIHLFVIVLLKPFLRGEWKLLSGSAIKHNGIDLEDEDDDGKKVQNVYLIVFSLDWFISTSDDENSAFVSHKSELNA